VDSTGTKEGSYGGILLVDQVYPAMVAELLCQAPLEFREPLLRAIGHDDDRAVSWKIPKDAEQGLYTLTFMTHYEGRLREEGIQDDELIGRQKMRESHSVDMHVFAPLHTREGYATQPLARGIEANVLLDSHDRISTLLTGGFHLLIIT